MNATLAYYAENAQAFFDSTHDKPMEEIYRKFLPSLPENAYILDAGCGSGRDSRYFLAQGYRVDAVDASPEMAALASTYIGQEVKCLAFDEIEGNECYDAIWASASLLHLPFGQLGQTLSRFASLLNEGGILYASFKYGGDEYVKEGRHFTPLNEEKAGKLFDEIRNLRLRNLWLSDDLRQDRQGEKWLNFLAKKGADDNS